MDKQFVNKNNKQYEYRNKNLNNNNNNNKNKLSNATGNNDSSSSLLSANTTSSTTNEQSGGGGGGGGGGTMSPKTMSTNSNIRSSSSCSSSSYQTPPPSSTQVPLPLPPSLQLHSPSLGNNSGNNMNNNINAATNLALYNATMHQFAAAAAVNYQQQHHNGMQLITPALVNTQFNGFSPVGISPASSQNLQQLQQPPGSIIGPLQSLLPNQNTSTVLGLSKRSFFFMPFSRSQKNMGQRLTNRDIEDFNQIQQKWSKIAIFDFYLSRNGPK